MTWAAVAIGGTAVVGAIASNEAARQQGNIAEAQMSQQERQRQEALRYVDPTKNAGGQEIKRLEDAIRLNDLDIARKQKLLESADPAVLEAGKQALGLLRGEEAKTLTPLKNNIARQEQALRTKLQAQLGPGYENTTAGIQALQAFNQQANDAISTAQQNSLGQLLGVAQDTSSRYGLQSNIQNNATISQIFGEQGGRQANIAINSPVSAAGAQFVGDLQQARGVQQTAGQLINLGSTLYGAGAFKKSSISDNPTQTSPTAIDGVSGGTYFGSGGIA